MEEIERCRVSRTLQGSKLYRKGMVFDAKIKQIPSEILQEVRMNTGTVEVLSYKTNEPPPVPVVEEKEPAPVIEEKETVPVEKRKEPTKRTKKLLVR